VSKYIAKDI